MTVSPYLKSSVLRGVVMPERPENFEGTTFHNDHPYIEALDRAKEESIEFEDTETAMIKLQENLDNWEKIVGEEVLDSSIVWEVEVVEQFRESVMQDWVEFGDQERLSFFEYRKVLRLKQ